MNKPSSSLTKTCSICGFLKPLSAFLEVTGPEGTTYSNICSSCRKTYLQDKEKKEQEESTTDTTKIRIDSKSKVHGDVSKEEHRQNQQELYEEEREKTEGELSKDILKTETSAKEEKKHRNSFLEKSALRGSKKNQETQAPSFEEQNTQEKNIDLSSPFIDTQHGDKLKFGEEFRKFRTAYGEEFKKFSTWIGKGSHIEKNAKNAAEKTDQKDKNKAITKDTVSDYSNKKWGPKK